MPRRIRSTLWPRALQRQFDALTRSVIRAGSKAITQALRPPRAAKVVRPKSSPAKPPRAKPASPTKPLRPKAATTARSAGSQSNRWINGIATTAAGARRYRVFRPPGIERGERVPLLVMLHGCGQDAKALAASSGMNRIAARERFIVLYPEQDRVANAQACWNWFETRSGRAQAEARIIVAAIDQVCLRLPIDPGRIGVAGLSAGAGMAALLGTLHPERFKAVAMHSGVGAGIANSTASALSAMRGHRVGAPLAAATAGKALPPLLVIHGSADPVVAVDNAAVAARRWAGAGAIASPPREVRRGARYPLTITDHRTTGALPAATLCIVAGLGHAWSGGAAGRRYSDPNGPDASRLIWRFFAKCFAAAPR